MNLSQIRKQWAFYINHSLRDLWRNGSRTAFALDMSVSCWAPIASERPRLRRWTPRTAAVGESGMDRIAIQRKMGSVGAVQPVDEASLESLINKLLTLF